MGDGEQRSAVVWAIFVAVGRTRINCRNSEQKPPDLDAIHV
jgi:hypothetical protein